ncbi:MAG: type IV pilus modification protein PilV [Burkholderiales bacterium]
MKKTLHRQSGASLIEVLVAVLILSFGLLSLGAMLSYSVQMPKLAAYRATAAMLASSHVERIRANPTGFTNGNYVDSMSYGDGIVYEDLAWCNGFLGSAGTSGQAQCKTTIDLQDKYESKRAIRKELPLGGMRVTCTGGNCGLGEGDLWIMWQEPSTFAQLDPTNLDECPDPTANPTFTAFVAPVPRCLHIKFKIEL